MLLANAVFGWSCLLHSNLSFFFFITQKDLFIGLVWLQIPILCKAAKYHLFSVSVHMFEMPHHSETHNRASATFHCL